MSGLRVGTGGFTLPVEVAGEAIALLGKRGSGKTNTGIVLAEEMYAAEIQIVVLDPVSAWWGVRSKLEIPIIGGQHGDLELSPTAGKLLADVVVDSGSSLVLDTSEFPSKAKVAGFVTDFLDHLYRRLARAPRLLHVFLEEADEFAPQKPFKEETRMLSAVEQVVRRGRGRGLGITMITQRSAVLNKNVLEQTDVLIAMRTTGPNDRKAIEGWVGKHAEDDAGDSVIASLPTLGTGQAWFWNPERGLLELQKVRARKTLDISGRIAPGQLVAEVKLKPIDLAQLGERIQATVERQKDNDPAELKARIRQLEREQAAGARAPAAVETIEVPVVSAERVRDLEKLLDQGGILSAQLEDHAGKLTGHAQALRESLAEMAAELSKAGTGTIEWIGPRPRPAGVQRSRTAEPAVPDRTVRSRTVRSDGQAVEVDGEHVKAGARRIVETLARHHPMRVTKAQLGTLAGFKITGGTFGAYYSQLKRLGLIAEEAGEIVVTVAGIEFSGVDVGNPMSEEEVLDRWRNVLKRGAREMLDVVLEAGSIDREQLAEQVQMTSSGGTFGAYLGTLRRNGLIEIDGPLVRPSSAFATR